MKIKNKKSIMKIIGVILIGVVVGLILINLVSALTFSSSIIINPIKVYENLKFSIFKANIDASKSSVISRNVFIFEPKREAISIDTIVKNYVRQKEVIIIKNEI